MEKGTCAPRGEFSLLEIGRGTPAVDILRD